MSIKPLFLDTSILVAQTIKVPFLSKTTLAECDPENTFCGAAEYAILEYYNVVIAKIGYLIGLFEKYSNLAHVREHVDRITAASYYPRHANICRDILTKVDIHLQNTFDNIYPSTSSDFQQARAEQAICDLKGFQRSWLDELNKLVSHWAKGTKCYWVAQMETLRDKFTGRVNCQKHTVRCDIIKLLQAKQSDLAKIVIIIAGLSADEKTKELQQLDHAISSFKAHPESAAVYERSKEKKGCRCFADALHVLESGTFNTIYSMNKKEFKPLCKAVGKSFLFQDHHGKRPTLYP